MMGSAPVPPDVFTRITEALIRKRAEHNEGMVSTLEEIALHQQNIGKIEALGQLCPKLKILYLQNNLISKLQNLHKLKDLTYLNMAVNNITRLENLQRCESLAKLDLTINFIDRAGLLTVASLRNNIHLAELILMGNPCTEWSGYRPFVIATLPQLRRLDGKDIKPSERIAAQQLLLQLTGELHADLRKRGINPDEAAQVEDDSLFDEEGRVRETGTLDEATGEIRRPWCAATRLLDHIENEQANRQAEEKKRAGSKANTALLDPPRPQRLTDFPELKDGERIMQRNEGRWEFSLEEEEDGRTDRRLVLEVEVGRHLDTSLIKADVQPTYVRLLIKGRLLQLLLPCEVAPDSTVAQRSQATGRLVLQMPKLVTDAPLNVAHIRPKAGGTGVVQAAASGALTASAMRLHGAQAVGKGSSAPGSAPLLREVRHAVVHALDADDDDDFVPALM